MDFLAPFRRCLHCLPFVQVSPPPPRLPPASESATKASPSPDPAELPQSSPAAPLPEEQDVAFPDRNEEKSRPLHSSSYDEIPSSESDGKRLPEVGNAVPVSRPPSSKFGASSHEAGEHSKPSAASEPSLHVPFINDVSYSTTGVLHLPIPMTPAPFGSGHGYPAGQYQPQIVPAGQADPRTENVDPKYTDDSEHADGSDQIRSQHGHESIHHGRDEPNHSHRHSDSDEGLSQKEPATIDDHDILETSISTPVFLGTEIEYKGGNDSPVATIADDSTPIDSYHSEPILPEVPEDDVYTQEGTSQDTSQPGRRRRRDHFKSQFKGFSQQIKQGGLHLKEEGGKHLQTVMTNINKQAQEFEQSRRFLVAPSLDKT